MKSKLTNQILEIEVSHSGAELCSILERRNERQWLWTGAADWWPRHAPVLFPIVGKLNNNQYQFGAKTYQLSQHGFARDRFHNLIETGENSLKFKLSHDSTSLEAFPFPFDLYTEYILNDNAITTRWTVKNTGDRTMYFSIGGHPGFLCPLNTEDVLDDYKIEFEVEETPVRWVLEEGLIAGKRSFGNIKEMALSEVLFSNDAVIFSELKSKYVLLKSKKRDAYLQFDFGGMPFLAFWKKAGAPFVCIEPWHGLADLKGHTGKLEEKFGIMRLNPDETFNCQYTIQIHSK